MFLWLHTWHWILLNKTTGLWRSVNYSDRQWLSKVSGQRLSHQLVLHPFRWRCRSLNPEPSEFKTADIPLTYSHSSTFGCQSDLCRGKLRKTAVVKVDMDNQFRPPLRNIYVSHCVTQGNKTLHYLLFAKISALCILVSHVQDTYPQNGDMFFCRDLRITILVLLLCIVIVHCRCNLT